MVLPWPHKHKLTEGLTAARIVGKTCARKTGIINELSGSLSLRLVFCPPAYLDVNLVDLIVMVMPYLQGVYSVIGVTPAQINEFTAAWSWETYGGRVEVTIEESNSR